MKSKWVKKVFKEVKWEDMDIVTAKEMLSMPRGHMFTAKLYVSDIRSLWCLKVEDERVEKL